MPPIRFVQFVLRFVTRCRLYSFIISMREATCAAPLTSKVPTEVGLLLESLFCAGNQTSGKPRENLRYFIHDVHNVQIFLRVAKIFSACFTNFFASNKNIFASYKNIFSSHKKEFYIVNINNMLSFINILLQMFFFYHERIIFNIKIFLLYNIFIYVSNTETFLLVLVGHRTKLCPVNSKSSLALPETTESRFVWSAEMLTTHCNTSSTQAYE